MTPEPPEEPTLDPRAFELALRVADDVPVDWEATRQSSADLDRTLERLRELQTLGDLHRRHEGEPPARAVFTWGALRAIEPLGEGGFGEVWRAWDPALERDVALKLHRIGAPAAHLARWLKEAQRLARVRHEHVLTVHGTDVREGRAGIWTEWIRGRTLEQILLAQGPFGARELVALGLDLCSALAAVHDAGLIHGDIKTRNVMREGVPAVSGSVAGAGRIVLMDFGSTTWIGMQDSSDSSGATPLFAAPEALSGGPSGVTTDIYSLGALLYRMASGHHPIDAASLEELREKHASGARRPLRTWRPDLPGALIETIERALEHDPARRYASAAEFERALAALHSAPGIAPRAHSAGLKFASFAAGAAAVAVLWSAVSLFPAWLRPRFTVRPHGPMPATRLVQNIEGRESLGALGWDVTAVGDQDGDGIADVLVSAPGENNPDGRVYLLRGTPSGMFEGWREFHGPHGGLFGFRVADVGDLDGDGVHEFAIAALTADSGGLPRTGAVLLYHGGAARDSSPMLTLYGERPSADFGFAIAAAGDVDHDGFGDMLVGAATDDRGGATTGRAYLYRGGRSISATPALVLKPNRAGGQFGVAACGIGDLNGDGVADFAIGANGDGTVGQGAGKVYVYFGGSALDADPDLQLVAAAAGDWFGCSIAALGDIDGDGTDDLAIGAERAFGYEEWGGTVSVFLGGASPATKPRYVLRGPGSNSKFAHVLAVGDVNGDHFRDVIVGAYGTSEQSRAQGSAIIYFGGPSMDETADLVLPGPSKQGNFAEAVAWVAELGNTGGPGLVVGSPDTQPGGELVTYRMQPVHNASRAPAR